VKNPQAAAIDVHSNNHVVCVGPDQVRTFGAYAVDLQAIVEYLRHHGVTTVVLESTGVYWVPLFELLERSLRRKAAQLGYTLVPKTAAPG
jgi:transposase